MSCLVMKRELLATLGSATAARLNLSFDFWGFEAPRELYDALTDCRTCGHYSEQAVYDRLYALNVRAYRGRYDEPFNPEDITGPDVNMARYAIHRKPEYRAHGFAVQPWHYQLAQLLDCYLYQTAEDATYNDPLRLALVKFRDALYAFIVSRSPQYTALQWGRLAPPYTPDKTGYQRSEETEPLILEPDDWEPGEWATLCKLAGHLPPQGTERIVISGYTLETFISKKEDGPRDGV